MDKVVQQTAAGSEESASAAEELASQAQVLRQTVEHLAGIIGEQLRQNTGNLSSSGQVKETEVKTKAVFGQIGDF